MSGSPGCRWIHDLPHRLVGLAPLPMRLAVGATMAIHGWGKISGERELSVVAASLVETLGLPASCAVLGYVAIASEFFGGLGLLLGLCTRLSALAVAGTMAGAVYTHAVMNGQAFKAGAAIASNGSAMGTGWEWQALLVATSLSLAILGGGCVSLDALLSTFCKGCRDPGGSAPGTCTT